MNGLHIFVIAAVLVVCVAFLLFVGKKYKK
ncbi:hypothetical protein SAMN04488602_12073 [Paenibacillus sp. cl123]|nr:hypothetical protein SAMN04488602_12073 [Paenibacillus sp. cl123]